MDRPWLAEGSARLFEVVNVDSVSWRKPGILEVVASRYATDARDNAVPIMEIVKYVDYRFVGGLHAIRVERVKDGVFKVSNVFRKYFGMGGGDNRIYGVRSGVERLPLHLAPFIDQILERYEGVVHPVTKEIEFSKTIPKKNLQKRPRTNFYNKPWTGLDWPELVDPPGHINNPFFGVKHFLACYSEFSMEEAYEGGDVNFWKLRPLGRASSPPFVFSFLGGGAKSVKSRLSGADSELDKDKKAQLKAQARWIMVEQALRRQGLDYSERRVWRSRVDPGWPNPVYRY